MSKSYSPTWRLISVIVLRPLLTLLIRNKWSGRENIPKKGGVIFAPNHLSYVDWGTDALFFQANGRYPTFLIKDDHRIAGYPEHRGEAERSGRRLQPACGRGARRTLLEHRLRVGAGHAARSASPRTPSVREPGTMLLGGTRAWKS